MLQIQEEEPSRSSYETQKIAQNNDRTSSTQHKHKEQSRSKRTSKLLNKRQPNMASNKDLIHLNLYESQRLDKIYRDVDTQNLSPHVSTGGSRERVNQKQQPLKQI